MNVDPNLDQLIQREMDNALQKEASGKRKRRSGKEERTARKRVCHSKKKEEEQEQATGCSSNPLQNAKSVASDDAIGAVQVPTGMKLLLRDYEILRNKYATLKGKFELARRCAQGKKQKIEKGEEQTEEEEWFFILARL